MTTLDLKTALDASAWSSCATVHAAGEALSSALLDSASDPDLIGRANQGCWELLAAWAVSCATEDSRRVLSQVGDWSLEPAQRILLSTGFVGSDFLKESCDSDPGEKLGQEFSQDFFDAGRGRVSLLPALIRSLYRAELQVDSQLAGMQAQEQAEVQLAEERAALDALRRGQIDLLLEAENSAALKPVQEKIHLILPQLAKVTVLGRSGGVAAEERRLHMKVFESARFLLNQINETITTYERRKRYEKQHAELIQRMIATRELEAQLDVSEGTEANGGMDRACCEAAAVAAVAQVRRHCQRVARSGADVVPPFVMAHTPRLCPSVVLEKYDQLLTACPRFEAAGTKEWYDLPEVVLVPGVGNCIYDPESRLVVGALFPIEVKLQSLIGCVGEAFLMRDDDVLESYRRLKKISRSDDSALREAFHKEFIAWVEYDSQGRRTLDAALGKWFEAQLVKRVTRA